MSAADLCAIIVSGTVFAVGSYFLLYMIAWMIDEWRNR